VEYRIVHENTSALGAVPYDQLAKIVNDLIAKGWRPLGAPFISSRALCQALTKE
jgi:phosphoribosylaminoimidazole (AIR) synthetase